MSEKEPINNEESQELSEDEERIESLKEEKIRILSDHGRMVDGRFVVPMSPEDEARVAEINEEIRRDDVKKELKSLKEEYSILEKKGYPTPEDEKRAAEIETRIKELEKPKEEVAPESESEEDLPERIKNEMSDEAKAKYESLTPRGKEIAEKFYNFIYRIPGLGKIVSGLAIWDGQRMTTINEKKMVKAKEKMDSIDLVVGSYEELKKELEDQIVEHEKDGLPGADSLKLKILEIDRSIERELEKKDQARSRFDKVENQASYWTNKRNEVVDKMLDIHNEKLAPLEAELSTLEKARDDLDLLDTVTRARHQRLANEIVSLEKRTDRLEEVLEKAGLSKRHEALKIMKKRIKEKEDLIRSEKEELRRRRGEIDERIMSVDNKAAKYRDERDNLTRIKNRKSLDIILEERQRVKDESERREVKGHTRESFEGEMGDWFKITEIVEDWNDYIEKEFAGGREDLVLGSPFLVGTGISNKEEFTLEQFKEILEVYGRNEGIDDIEDIINQYQSKL